MERKELMKKLNKKIMLFIENWLLICFFAIFLIFTIILVTINILYPNSTHGMTQCVINIMAYFYSHQDIVVTSATVLIGIYFTMYTIFAVYNSSSVIAKLYSTGFQKLLKLLKHAMTSSVLVLIFGFLSDWIVSLGTDASYVINLTVNFFLNLYFIITSLICGFLIYMIFKEDIKGLEQQKLDNEEKEALMHNLKIFLEREQEKEDRRLDNTK